VNHVLELTPKKKHKRGEEKGRGIIPLGGKEGEKRPMGGKTRPKKGKGLKTLSQSTDDYRGNLLEVLQR